MTYAMIDAVNPNLNNPFILESRKLLLYLLGTVSYCICSYEVVLYISHIMTDSFKVGRTLCVRSLQDSVF